jgi:Fe-S-cluster-containing dehydrogenase component/anaerobic selenocysteine-containing dehydrogenase
MTPREYWRSPDDQTGTPGAPPRDEFPGFANVFESLGEAEPADDDPHAAALSRRGFLTLSAAAGLAGLAGCRRPDLEILPFSAIPDEQVGHLAPGKPTFYATCLPRPGGALPVLVESHEGRPTKVEGNPAHPCSRGSTDAHAQASIYDLYSPDRVMSDRYPGVMERGLPRKWEDFDRFARHEADRLVKEKGKGFYVLAEDLGSPSVRLIRRHMKKAMPEAVWVTYEPCDTSEAQRGAEIAFGAKLAVRYRFDKADRILALDCDFLGHGPDAVANSRAFAAKRAANPMNRLYVVESTYSVTGTIADHRLKLASSQVGGFLVAVAKELTAHKDKLKHAGSLPGQLGSAAPAFVLPETWVKAVAKDLAEHAEKGLIVVGDRQPAWVHALAHALNDALGNTANVGFRDPPPEAAEEKAIGELARDMAAGKVNTLLVIGGNPVLNAPADLNFKAELQKVARKVRLGLYHDHTSEACDWHLPLAHPLESWGDAEAADGTLCCVQPLIAPLNGNRPIGTDPAAELAPPPRGGRSVLEVLTLMTQYALPEGATKANPATTSYVVAKGRAYELVRRAFAERSGIAVTDPNFATEFNRYKQLGFLPAEKDKSRKPKDPGEVKVNIDAVRKALAGQQPVPAPSKEAIEVGFYPSYSVLDGRFAMNPWMQEFPDPITKLVWDNAALVSPRTAAEFRVKTGDRVKLTVKGTVLDIPVFVLPGQADYTVALPFGQFGEMRISHVPDGGGFDVFPARKTDALHFATGCRLEPTGKSYDLVTTQEHGVIPEGRDIVREVNAGTVSRESKTSASHDGQGHGHGPVIGIPPDGHVTPGDLRKGFQGGYGNPPADRGPPEVKQRRFPLDLARPELLDSQFQWGMVIDLSACTGCSACVVACQAENNIPVVGKADVKRNREMHWIRIDRYFTGPAADDPQVVTQPLACVHCEQAPCEPVCPVNASVHSADGLNLQVYNRCIGTRYCSNNCPYKVRRFNWFDFNKRRPDELRVPTPFAREGMALQDTGVPETLKMQKNPDVTVRMRGVMEKCTYCVQRLERAKYGSKIAAAEVAQGRAVIETDAGFRPEGGSPSAYRKPKDPRAAGYDLDAQGRVIVPDGLVDVACAQACPTRAITFGNVLNPHSRVARLKQTEGEYLLLGELNTKPRTSYLPRVRNPNPELTG